MGPARRLEAMTGQRLQAWFRAPGGRTSPVLLRAAAGEADPEIAAWWTRLQELPEQERIAEVEGRPAEPGEAPRRKRRPRRRRKRPATP